MARGDSGRIVIEVEPEAKRQLYAALALTGSTLKDWFIKRAADFCSEANQPSLFTLSAEALPNKLQPEATIRGPRNAPATSGNQRGKTVKSKIST